MLCVCLALGSSGLANAQTNCTPRPSGLVAWWPGDGFALDVVGTNHGTLQNGATYAAGEAGQGFKLDGVDDYVSMLASPSLNVGTGSGFSIALWVKPANVGNHPLVEWNNGAAVGVQFWIYSAPGQLYGCVTDTGGNNHAFTSASGVLATNTFQHVALTYDKATGLGRLFRNGVVVAQATLGSVTPQTTYNLYLGFRPAPAGYTPYAGGMDEVSLFNRG